VLTCNRRNGWNGPPARGGYDSPPSNRNSYSSGGGGPGGGGAGGFGRSASGAFGDRRSSSGWGSDRSDRSSNYGGGGGGRGGDGPGFGTWKDGKHIQGSRNTRMEKELFGEPDDPSKQHTGINFEKYDDIPVEATGAGVPEPVIEFTNPPLDPVLLENIQSARYTQPTPVQKYSIPIVAAGRDLMACAQVNPLIAYKSHTRA
jgi:ATP-dependent RNA helicase DDX3X